MLDSLFLHNTYIFGLIFTWEPSCHCTCTCVYLLEESTTHHINCWYVILVKLKNTTYMRKDFSVSYSIPLIMFMTSFYDSFVPTIRSLQEECEDERFSFKRSHLVLSVHKIHVCFDWFVGLVVLNVKWT